MPLGTPTRRARVADLVRGLVSRVRTPDMSPEDVELLPHLRGNGILCDALCGLIQSRIRARENAPLPPDPVDCKATMAMDKELRWLIKKIEFLRDAPMNTQDNDEPTQ